MTAQKVPVAAVILAAGLGRRLGHRPKAALQIDGVSIMERLILTLRSAGLAQVNVVIGAYPETLVPLAEHGGAGALMHGRPDTSLIESQRLALNDHLSRHGHHDLLLVLADLPHLKPEDVRALLTSWWNRPAFIHAQMPVVGGARGHPLLLSALAVEQVLSTPTNAGIRDWLSKNPHVVRPVVTTQRAYVTDLDTPEDLATLIATLAPEPVHWPAQLELSSANTSRAAAKPFRADGNPA